MITGTSNANAIIILVDARQGVLEQTRRHSIIASLLKVSHVIVAINKMDLVGFSKEVYDRIVDDYKTVASQLALKDVMYIPISALKGDNIVDPSQYMDWYNGKSLLQLLEDLELNDDVNLEHPRFQVQFVIRPQTKELHDYRGYAGKISSGIYRKGDKVAILPNQLVSTISKIEVAGKEVQEAFAPQSVVLHLEDDVDVSRGDLIVNINDQPILHNEAEVLLCWLDEKPLQVGNKYLLQQGSRLVRTIVTDIAYKLDVNTLEQIPVEGLVKLNEVVKAKIKTPSPLVFDAYANLQSNGAAIFVDETGNSTVAAVLFQ
jgi:sulfate adenylyltransferase subunit 1